MGCKIKLWKLVNELVQCSSHLRISYKLPKLLRRKVIIPFPGQILFLQLHQYFIRNTSKLTKWCLDTPHPLLNHFAQIQSLLSQLSPSSFQDYLKQCSHKTSRTLCYINHV
uniref:Uncharacterized protein n=1 Tax=Opuntia streptacantha TaxID=393608 RepID=A0A7C9A7V5_OPUST